MLSSEEVVLITNSAEETQNLAASLAPLLKAGDVINLSGDLGAGKTCFTKGVARGLGIKDKVTSPTFNLIKEYMNSFPLYHFDVYRLDGPDELGDLGYEEYFYGTGITIIEWGDKILSLLPEIHLRIEFKRLLDEEARELRISYQEMHWEEIVKNWLDRWAKRKKPRGVNHGS
jgi:tRNA threonylcarbamoyladenosine biosynthesis protein TsaE